MADFRMKLFVLAGMATVFTGLAFGQATCTAGANAVFVRSESNDDQVADTTLTCNSGVAGVGVNQTMNMTVYLSPSVNITSANIGTSSTPVSEAVAGLGVQGGTLTAAKNGSVSGNSVSFSGINIGGGAGIPPSTAFTVTITNIKIAASTVATSSGVPTGISETIFLSGTGVTPAAITTASAVAYVTSGLSGIKSSGANPNPLCNATNTFNGAGTETANFSIAFAEAFPNSFKIQGSPAQDGTLGSEFTLHTETGYTQTATTANTATSGTRIKIIFNNIPANVSIFVPLLINGNNGGTVKLSSSETAADTAPNTPPAPTPATSNGNPTAGVGGSNVPGDGSTSSLAVTSGSATAIYEVTAISTAPSTFSVPVYLQASAGAVSAPTSAITATVSFAPIGATSNVPNFINGASTTTVNGSTFAACSTTLLFPYVTNQAGFESGLAISNTGADLLATKNGAPISSVTGQSGTCLLTFFGNATASSNPAAFTTAAAVAPGTTWTGTLTSVTGGTPNTFGGYMIAQCNFLYGHGFTYITYNIGQSSGMAMGYLALDVVVGSTTGPSRAPGVGGSAIGSSSPEALNN
jgi:hypothetical protein